MSFGLRKISKCAKKRLTQREWKCVRGGEERHETTGTSRSFAISITTGSAMRPDIALAKPQNESAKRSIANQPSIPKFLDASMRCERRGTRCSYYRAADRVW